MKLKDYEISYRKSKHKEAEILKTKITTLNNIDAKKKQKKCYIQNILSLV